MSQAPKREGGREPIPVRILKFAEPQSGAGLSVASSCTAFDPEGTVQARQSRHAVEYLPWIRQFAITYHAPDREPETVMIPEHRVSEWYPPKGFHLVPRGKVAAER